MKSDQYYFHQSPIDLCKKIISDINFKEGDIVLEPFAGENNFFKNIPEGVVKHRCEIEDGLDFKNFDYEGIKPNIIITNPPFRLDGKNAFNYILNFFAQVPSIEEMYILCNHSCLSSLTPKRIKVLNDNNMYINEITICNICKWYGRYYIIKFCRYENQSFKYYLDLY